MADPSPAAAPTGQEPAEVEGKTPDPGDGAPTEGQEPEERTYSASYVKQLRRENAESRTRLAELEALVKSQEDEKKTELERATERATTAEAKAQAAELRVLRFEIAAEHGLDATAASFLTGTTREEMEHRAEELGKLLKQGTPTGRFDGGARPPAPPEKQSPGEAHNELLLRSMGRLPQSR